MPAPITDPALLATSDYAVPGATWKALPEDIREMFRAYSGRVWREEYRVSERTGEMQGVLVFRLSGSAWQSIQAAITRAALSAWPPPPRAGGRLAPEPQ